MRRLVIIPTYNEIENISKMIETVMALEGEFSLLIVDDGSPDGTAGVVESYMEQYPQRVNLLKRSGKLGLGTAYLAGFEWALKGDYDYIFEMDCDFSHNPKDLLRLSKMMDKGVDVAVGSRYVKGVNVINWPMSRLLLSFCASRYVQIMTGMPVRDATAGFVGYKRKVLKRIDPQQIRMKGYGFQVEMKYTSWKLGFRIGEVSIIFTDRTEGTSKMSGGIFSEALLGVMKLPLRRIVGRK